MGYRDGSASDRERGRSAEPAEIQAQMRQRYQVGEGSNPYEAAPVFYAQIHAASYGMPGILVGDRRFGWGFGIYSPQRVPRRAPVKRSVP